MRLPGIGIGPNERSDMNTMKKSNCPRSITHISVLKSSQGHSFCLPEDLKQACQACRQKPKVDLNGRLKHINFQVNKCRCRIKIENKIVNIRGLPGTNCH